MIFNICSKLIGKKNKTKDERKYLHNENICWLSGAAFGLIRLHAPLPAHHAEMLPPGWHRIDLHSYCFVWGQGASAVELPESELIDMFSFAAINLSSCDPRNPTSWTRWRVSTARLHMRDSSALRVSFDRIRHRQNAAFSGTRQLCLAFSL